MSECTHDEVFVNDGKRLCNDINCDKIFTQEEIEEGFSERGRILSELKDLITRAEGDLYTCDTEGARHYLEMAIDLMNGEDIYKPLSSPQA